MPKMAQFFAKEIKETGTDSLVKEDWDRIKEEEDKLLIPYKKDPSLFLKEMAALSMYYKMNKTAISYAWKSVLLTPFDWNSWKLLQYCIRKTLIRV